MKRVFKLAFLSVIATITLASCNNGPQVIFQEYKTFTNEKWLRQDDQKFELNIKNIDDCYNIYACMKLDTSFVRGREMPLIMNLYSENGERRNWRSMIYLKDNNGAWMFPIEGKYLVVDHKVKEYFFFNSTGSHRLEIHHGTDRYELNGVNQMGIRIEKAELVYPK